MAMIVGHPVVALVKGKKAGLRSEEIRTALRLGRREVPRVLKAVAAVRRETSLELLHGRAHIDLLGPRRRVLRV